MTVIKDDYVGYIDLRKESDTMEGKVLLFIRDYQLKIKIIPTLTDMHVSFIEVFEKEELPFKMKLITHTNKLYIHEYIHDYEEQYKKIRTMKENGWKILVIFPKYEIKYIDACQEAGVDDLMARPFEVTSFRKKVTTLMRLPQLRVLDSNDGINDFKSNVELEVNRAIRGNYDLSFVMVDLSVVAAEEKVLFVDVLKNALRETDIVLNTHEKDYYLIVCPFTPKNFLVEVENKIRHQFNINKESGVISTKGKLYLYGLTLGSDGDDFETIYTKLMSSINNSKILDRAISQNIRYDKRKVNNYKTILRKFQ